MFVCEICGTLHADQVKCCDQDTRPLDEAWSEQGKLFELQGNERAHNVMDHLKGEYEASAVLVRKISDKLTAAIEKRDEAAQLLADFLKLSVQEDPPDVDPDLPASLPDNLEE